MVDDVNLGYWIPVILSGAFCVFVAVVTLASLFHPDGFLHREIFGYSKRTHR